ncbi:hypothetical protein M3M33_16820, partial [Loigolactobacillus coryniformis]|uniref:hypothetical protein n=1 Tax=Loigolactobacillus coryniformis TaxID=1610 RepID=UPI00201A3863
MREFIIKKVNLVISTESIKPGSITEKHNTKLKIMSKYQRTLVVDSSFMARSIISTERAFVISYKGNAEVVAEHPETFG